jgi:hypothetical protein
VVAAVGEKAPSMFVLAFIPMLLVAFAYREPRSTCTGSLASMHWRTH